MTGRHDSQHRAGPATEAELRAVWVQRRRADWPTGFEACMAEALYAAILRCEVNRLRSFVTLPRPAGRAALHVPMVIAARAAPPTFDRKRLAAGERPDAD